MSLWFKKFHLLKRIMKNKARNVASREIREDTSDTMSRGSTYWVWRMEQLVELVVCGNSVMELKVVAMRWFTQVTYSSPEYLLC